MPPEQNRRRFLCLVGGAASVTTAGCQSLTSSDDSSGEPPLSLQIFNYTSEPQEVEVEIIDPDVDEEPEAVVYSVPSDTSEDRVEIQPAPEEEGIANQRTFEDVAETQPYTVRFRIAGATTERWSHFHYNPASNTDDLFINLRIYRDGETNEDIIRHDI